ncbi:MAG: ABC transporter ATP-binding protein [Hydrogenophaga sp.]
MSTDSALLQLRDWRVSFGGVPVVHGLNVDIRAGEKWAIVGESGSGKTVSALSILRLLPDAQVTGSALFDGRELSQLSEREMRGVRGDDIAMIFQEPMTALNPLYAVGEQIAEVLRLKKGMDAAQARAAAVALLASTGIADAARRAGSFPHQLSGGQRQRAMIAMALASAPRLLLADEPTTALDVSLRQQMLELLADVQRQHGMALVLITHDLPLVLRFADHVLVMERGHVVEQGRVADVFGAPQHPYTQQLLASRPERDADLDGPAPAGAPVLSAEGLGVSYPVPRPGWRGWFGRGSVDAVRDVSLTLGPGRTLGVMGESGSGKTTLALALLGLIKHTGRLCLGDTDWATAQRSGGERALRQRVQVVFQDPFSSLSPRMTVEQIVGEGLRVHRPELSAAQRRAEVLQALCDVGLADSATAAEPLLPRYPHAFSGGQRQRLAIARALVVRPQLLVLDEPTSALDVTVQKQVLGLLQRLQLERGLAYVLITHDVAVIRAMAHEVLVMKDAQVVEQGPVDRVLTAPAHPYTRKLVESAHE